jgi:hypothetical protein
MRESRLSVSRLSGLTLSAGLVLLLGACSTLSTLTLDPTDPKATERAAKALACGAFSPISYSRRDTEQTKVLVQGHNAVYTDLCGHKNQSRVGPITLPTPVK